MFMTTYGADIYTDAPLRVHVGRKWSGPPSRPQRFRAAAFMGKPKLEQAAGTLQSSQQAKGAPWYPLSMGRVGGSVQDRAADLLFIAAEYRTEAPLSFFFLVFPLS